MINKNIRPAISSICNMNCTYCSSSNGSSNARMEDFRRTARSNGRLNTEQWFDIFKCFYDAGFRGISLTGGEPTLNHDWIEMLKYCKKLGYLATEITSNLLILDKFSKELVTARDYITKFKVSLDTFNRNRFRELTGIDALDKIISNIRLLVALGYDVQLNRVTMKATQNELVDYIEKASTLNVSVKLLDLVYYRGNGSKNDFHFWKENYISAKEMWEFLSDFLVDFSPMQPDFRYGYNAMYNNMNIIFKDSQRTKRSMRCEKCPLYCQEGIFTVRIGSDGTITTCPDYQGILPYIDGVEALRENSLTEQLKEIYKEFETPEDNYFYEYMEKLQNGNCDDALKD